MRLKKLALIGAAALGFLGAANAAELVCVNNEEILKRSSYALKVQQEVQQKEQELKAALEQKVKPLQEKLNLLQQQIQSGLLSQEAVKQKQEEMLQIQRQIQQMVIETQAEFQKFAQERFQSLDELEKKALEMLARQYGFKAVIDCRALLYYSPEIDMTDETARAMDDLASRSP